MNIPFKTRLIILCMILAGVSGALYGRLTSDPVQKVRIEDRILSMDEYKALLEAEIKPLERTFYAGDYLASRFAQQRHDWNKASEHIYTLIKAGIGSDDILQRAMILAMGSGNTEEALVIAEDLAEREKGGIQTVAEIFLVARDMKQDRFEGAAERLNNLPNDGTMIFIGPFLEGWINASLNNLKVTSLRNNTIQLYHAILISDYLNNHDQIEKMIDKANTVEDINIYEKERIADLYGHVGLTEKALKAYDFILKKDPENKAIQEKVENLKNGTTEPLFEKISSAKHGLAKAFHDISKVLFDEQNEETARVFAHLALYLKSDLTETILLLADINAKHGQYAEAINLYTSIPETHPQYRESQFKIVDIYEELERHDDALALLNTLSENEKNIDVMIEIGNVYRHKEKYSKALKAYDKAAALFENGITEEYWHLHYVRGIALEQTDQWKKAENELKAALEYKPNHPYILNYLGYAWADRNENLTEALEMIKKAVELRPADGYITDSLGWVYYRIGDYKNAVKYLERAVELLPADPTVNDHLGDAYWHVGRKVEARFQWKRAKNHSDDAEMISEIDKKLSSGLKVSKTE
ncbi:MAG: tetratricopeptide repeat protein [Alphaproteobacteria bacterium]|nr:tetratricopeptide repeat protein [Alphaproteobacteria bacterium]